MTKRKTKPTTYITALKKRIEKRVGEVEDFLVPMIETTARHWMLHDKLWEELMDGNMVTSKSGSMGQEKQEVNPLLAQYEKLHRSLTDDLTALGLNYNTTPSKVTENTKKGIDETDPMAAFYASAK